MQIVHDTLSKKTMQVVDDGKEEKLKTFNVEKALDDMEYSEEPTETTEAIEEEPQEATEEINEVDEPQEIEATSEDDEEPIPKKKSRLQRRIDELVRERSSVQDERNQYANQIEILKNELQKKSTLNSDYDNLQENLYETRLSAANKLLDSARSTHKSAYESGDSDKLLEAAESIADAKVELKTLEQQKHLFKKKTEEKTIQPTYNNNVQQTVQQQPQVQQPDPRALQWAQTNNWFGQDAARTGAAYAIDAQLKMEGYNPSSEEYYSELDLRLGQSFSDLKEKSSKPKQVVASVSRATSASKKKVTLSLSQLAMARKLGVPASEYAKFVRNAND